MSYEYVLCYLCRKCGMYMCIILYNTHVHVCVGCTVIIVTCGDTDVHTVHVCSFLQASVCCGNGHVTGTVLLINPFIKFYWAHFGVVYIVVGLHCLLYKCMYYMFVYALVYNYTYCMCPVFTCM